MAQRLDRINRFLDGVKRNRREIVSPEGIVLEVDVANNGDGGRPNLFFGSDIGNVTQRAFN